MSNISEEANTAPRHGTAIASTIAATTVGAAVAANAARDAVFLDAFSASDLPWVMIPAAIATLVFAVLASLLLRTIGPNRFGPWLYAGCGVAVIGSLGLQNLSEHVAAVFLYLLVAAVVGSLMPATWAMLNERFDPTSGKSAFTRIAWMSTLGSVIGGLLAERTAKWLGSDVVLVAIGVSLLAAAGGLRWVALQWRPLKGFEPSQSSNAAPVARRYLIALAALMLTLELGGQFVDYLFKDAASAELSGDGLLRFFAVFYAALGLVGFLGQVVITPKLLDRLGPGKTSAFMPVALASVALTGFVANPLIAGSALRAARGTSKTIFHRASYELFFVPIPRSMKRTSKLLIDVGATSIGGVLGGALLALLLQLEAATTTLFIVVIAVAVLQFAAVGFVTWAYTRNLAHSVIAQVEELDISRSLALNRASVMPLDHPQEVQPAEPSVLSDEIYQLLRDRSDPEAIRTCLSQPLDETYLPLIIDLLSWDAVSDQAKRQLATRAPRHAGQLADALLDPQRPFAVRRRVAQVLAHAEPERAIPPLLQGLNDEEFEVRVRCARTLARFRAQGSELPVDPIREALLAECELSPRVRAQRRLLDSDDDGIFSAEAEEELQHTFTLLACLLEVEPVQSTYASLVSGDEAARGTGLEYLQQVLDAEIHTALLPLVEERYLAEAS